MGQSTRLTLIQRVSNSEDEKSWEEFVEVYRNYIMGFVKKMGVDYDEVEDVTQRILLKLWQKLPEFEYRPGECKFRSWMAVISRNIIKDYRKLNQNKMRRNLDYVKEADSEVDAEIDLLALSEWKEFISEVAWLRISKRFNKTELDIFILSSKKSVAEIAEEKGLAEPTVYVYRKRIETAFKKEIININYELG